MRGHQRSTHMLSFLEAYNYYLPFQVTESFVEQIILLNIHNDHARMHYLRQVQLFKAKAIQPPPNLILSDRVQNAICPHPIRCTITICSLAIEEIHFIRIKVIFAKINIKDRTLSFCRILIVVVFYIRNRIWGNTEVK